MQCIPNISSHCGDMSPCIAIKYTVNEVISEIELHTTHTLLLYRYAMRMN